MPRKPYLLAFFRRPTRDPNSYKASRYIKLFGKTTNTSNISIHRRKFFHLSRWAVSMSNLNSQNLLRNWNYCVNVSWNRECKCFPPYVFSFSWRGKFKKSFLITLSTLNNLFNFFHSNWREKFFTLHSFFPFWLCLSQGKRNRYSDFGFIS